MSAIKTKTESTSSISIADLADLGLIPWANQNLGTGDCRYEFFNPKVMVKIPKDKLDELTSIVRHIEGKREALRVAEEQAKERAKRGDIFRAPKPGDHLEFVTETPLHEVKLKAEVVEATYTDKETGKQTRRVSAHPPTPRVRAMKRAKPVMDETNSWMTADGRQIYIVDMPPEHLVNAYNQWWQIRHDHFLQYKEAVNAPVPPYFERKLNYISRLKNEVWRTTQKLEPLRQEVLRRLQYGLLDPRNLKPTNLESVD